MCAQTMSKGYLVPKSCGIQWNISMELGGLATMFVALDILLRQYAVSQAFREKKTEVHSTPQAQQGC